MNDESDLNMLDWICEMDVLEEYMMYKMLGILVWIIEKLIFGFIVFKW